MAEENQENFPNTKIKITKIVKEEEDSLKSESSLFNLSVTQQTLASSDSDSTIKPKTKKKSPKPKKTSSAASTSISTINRNNLALVESRYANLLKNIRILDVMYDDIHQNKPTVMTSLPSIPLSDLRESRESHNLESRGSYVEFPVIHNLQPTNNFIELPGTHTTATATEDLVITMGTGSQTFENIFEPTLSVSTSTEQMILESRKQRREILDDVKLQEVQIQINLERNDEILLNRNSSDFIPFIPAILTDAIEIEDEKPSLWARIKAGCITFCNMVGGFLCHNREFFICLAFFGGFIVCTAFLTAFFYEILTIDPEHILYPTINDKVYFSDRQSKY